LASRRQSVNTASLVGIGVLLLIGAIVLANVTKPPRPEPRPTPAVTLTLSTTPTSMTPGPTTPGASTQVPAAFDVTASPVVLTDPVDDFRDGVITLSVRADGPGEVAAALLIITSAERRPGGDWDRCGTDSDAEWALCDLGVLVVGSSMTLQLPIRVGPDVDLTEGAIGTYTLRADQTRYDSETIRVANP
jgi:hypothetical protein